MGDLGEGIDGIELIGIVDTDGGGSKKGDEFIDVERGFGSDL